MYAFAACLSCVSTPFVILVSEFNSFKWAQSLEGGGPVKRPWVEIYFYGNTIRIIVHFLHRKIWIGTVGANINF